MDPLTLGIGAVGLGMSLYGGIAGAHEANKAYGIQKDITGLESNVNDQRQAQMTLSASRQQLENFRNVQRARAQGMAAAVNQGAQQGTGLQGGQAQASGQGTFNSMGINQNLQIGNNIFGLDKKISNDKMALSDVQSSMATDQAIAGFGNSMMKGAGTMSNIGQAGASTIGNIFSLFSPGSISGGM